MGNRLPLKWMSPEAIRNGEFSIKRDVWAFGILLFEIITLGGSPYPEWRAVEVFPNLEQGLRMLKPLNCPDKCYSLMFLCWQNDSCLRPDFSFIRKQLTTLIQEM